MLLLAQRQRARSLITEARARESTLKSQGECDMAPFLSPFIIRNYHSKSSHKIAAQLLVIGAMSFTGGSTMMQTPLLMSTLMDRGPRLQPDELVVTKVEGGYHTLSCR